MTCRINNRKESVFCLFCLGNSVFIIIPDFLPHDLNGSRFKKANLIFFFFVVVVAVAIFSAGCT